MAPGGLGLSPKTIGWAESHPCFAYNLSIFADVESDNSATHPQTEGANAHDDQAEIHAAAA